MKQFLHNSISQRREGFQEGATASWKIYINAPGWLKNLHWMLALPALLLSMNTVQAQSTPVANPDQLPGTACKSIYFTATQLLANDYHPQGGNLEITQVLQPSSGTITDHNNGNYTYTPAAGHTGPVTFTYVIKKDDATVAYSGNGHFYEYISSPNICWTTAKAAAEQRSYQGMQGYLATITSSGENSFAASKLQGNGWIGGSDQAVEGVWRWATGPEAGQQFYWQNGYFAGYNSWAGGEPNNAGYEHYAHFYSGQGTWNDLSNCPASGWISGYVVEYGGMEATTPQLTATGTVTITLSPPAPPQVNTKDISVTLNSSGTATITGSQVDNGSSSTCGTVSLSVSPNSFTCNNVGKNTVTLSVTDNYGQTSTRTATVNVVGITGVTITPSATTINYGSSTTLLANATTKTYYIPLAQLVNVSIVNYCGTDSYYGSSNVGFRWTDNGSGTVSNVKVEFSVGVECHQNKTHNTTINGVAGPSFSQTPYFCNCGVPSSAKIVTLNYANPSGYVTGGNNTFAVTNSATFGFYPAASLNNNYAKVTVTYSSGSTGAGLTYTWTPGNLTGSSITVSPTQTTTYTLTASNAGGCTATANATVTVTPPPVSFTLAQTSVSCSGGNDGSITVTATGGTAYEYSLDNGAFVTGSTFSGLAAGTYSVRVRSGNFITAAQSISVNTATDLTAPVAKSKNVTVHLNAAGNATVTPQQVDNGSSDACSNVSLSLDRTTFNCADMAVSSTATLVSDAGWVQSTVELVTPNGTMQTVAANLPAANTYTIPVQNVYPYGGSLIFAPAVPGALPIYSRGGTKFFKRDFVLTGQPSSLRIRARVDNMMEIFVNGQSIGLESTLDTRNFSHTALHDIYIDANGVQNGYQGGMGFDQVTSQSILSLLHEGANELIFVIANTNGTDEGGFAVRMDAVAKGVPVTLTATDQNGNAATSNAYVVVEDKLAPTMVTNAITVNLVNRNAYVLSQSEINKLGSLSSDNCSVSFAITSGQKSYTCSNIGQTFTLMLKGTDQSGNTASVPVMVTVADPNSVCNEPPVAVCKNIILNTNGSCQASLTAQQVNGGSSDPDGDALTYTLSNYGPFGVGTHQVTLTVNDGEYTANCTATVTVLDNTAPVAIAQNFTAQLDANGNATITAAQVNNGSSDACGIATMTVSPGSFSCANIGPNTVTLTVTDINGNLSTANATVMVEDNVAPTAVCKNVTVQLDGNGQATIIQQATTTQVFTEDFTSDGTGLRTVSTSINNWNVLYGNIDIGNWIPQLNSVEIDLGGDMNAAIETKQSLNLTPGIYEFSVKHIRNSHNTFFTVYIGNLASRTFNSTSIVETGKFTFTVTAPVAVKIKLVQGGTNDNTGSFIDDIVLTKQQPGGLAIEGGSFDNCGVSSIVASQTNFTCANVGANNVMLTVTDINGNSASCTAVVTVEDNVAPIALAQNLTIQLDANGAASVTAAQVNKGSSDACGIASMTVAPSNFTCTNVGPNLVTLTVIDNNGNVSTVTATVTVEDNVAPVAIAQNLTLQLDANGNASITAAQVNNGSSDACGIETMTVSPASFSCSNVGPNKVTLTVTDNNGNASTATATVTVEDNVAPVVATNNITVQLDATGAAKITESMIDNGSSDACGIATYALSNNSFSCANVGANTVTLTVTDVNGNVATANATVTVEDNIAPVVVTRNITVQLDASGNASISANQIDNGSSDACGIETYSLDKQHFACSNVGTNTVTLTVTDVNGNISTGTATVTVEDNVAPVASTQNISVTLANGVATITAAQINNGSSDACGIKSMTLDNTSFDCSDLGANAVVLKVTDNNNNVSTANATVNVIGVIPAPAIAVSRTDNTNTKADGNTIFLGYGAQKVTLTASNSTSAAGATTYSWSPSTGLSNANSANPVFTPATAGNYTFIVTATNEFGCTATASVTIKVTDVRCGNKNDKVMICHNGHMICVSPNAVPAHLAHAGDYLGNCDNSGARIAVSTNEVMMKAYPNPFTDMLTVDFNLTKSGKYSVEMLDMKGALISVVEQGIGEAGKAYSLDINGANLSTGIYIIRLVSASDVKHLKVVLEK